nr:putative ribonuclease H-like domain-containing protein [Tanacetum cinerariifolium]
MFAPVPTDRGYSPSVISGWWKNTARPMPHFSRPTSSYFQTYTPYVPTMYYNHMKYGGDRWETAVKSSPDTEGERVFDRGCSRSMTGNKERLDDFQVFQGRKVTFGGGECRITRKGTIRTPTLDFKNVYYVKELQQFNLFSISQICDKNNRVFFTDTECLVLSKDFKLPDGSMVLLRVPKKYNLYTINLNNLCPRGNLACLVAHASVDESVKWHRRMGHVNYKNMNRLVKEHKDETYPILKDFINLVENQLNKKVKAMTCDNVRTACHVLNRVLVTSPHNKTPYALLTWNIPSVCHFKPFGCHVTILNTSDHLGKFDGKADEGYIVGYFASNKAYRVYNMPNKRVEETMNLRYLEEKPNVQGLGTQDADSDSDCDEQVIIVPSYPSHSIQGTEPKDTSGDKVDDSPLNSADEIFQKELARLKVPPGSIPVPSGDTMVSTDDVPVHSSSPTDSFFDDEPTTRFPNPFDLGNHDPSPVEPSSVAQALKDPSWVDDMQEEMQQIKFQNVWVLVVFLEGKYAIGTKWILKNKRDAREIVIRNKARLVAQGHRHEEGINYDEVFPPIARIEAIRLFLAFASYMGFMVYQMDVKSAFLYRRFDEEVYVTQPKGFVDPQHPKKVYKIVKALYGLHQAPRAWTATTPYVAPKPKSKNESDSPVNVHLYRSMIGSLMYLTASRPDIMFAVSACSRNQVTPTTSNLKVVKKIFKYLKGQPKLGLWRLISWQCKKQTIVATSSTEAEYVVVATCCGQPHGSRGSPELGPPAIQVTIHKTSYTIAEDLV